MRVHIEPASPINISNKPQSSIWNGQLDPRPKSNRACLGYVTDSCFITPRFGGSSVMVWAEISAQGKTDLHVIDNGRLTALRYVNEILDVYVRPYAGAVGENFILMDDNARAHRARITDQYLEQATIVRMEWPARSPDLNPIEHAWDMLQTAVSSRPVQPASVQELRQALLEEWDQIPQYKIRRLISSMRRH